MKQHKGQNPIPIVWNGKTYKSSAELSRELGLEKSTIHKALKEDRPIKGHYIDLVI